MMMVDSLEPHSPPLPLHGCRFFDVNGGSVRVGGHDLRDIQLDSLRAAIGKVPQDTVLFNDTILYNIGYGKLGASREQVQWGWG